MPVMSAWPVKEVQVQGSECIYAWLQKAETIPETNNSLSETCLCPQLLCLQ